MEKDVNDIIAIKQILSESINKNNYDYIKNLIDKNVKDCNLLYTQVCYLIKLFLLNDYENNNLNNDYEFNEHFIRFCFKLIKSNGLNCDKNINGITLRIYNFYMDFNKKNDNKIKFICPDNISSLTHISDALSRDIQTNIKNNITINYFKYIKEYVKINLNLEFKNNIQINLDIDLKNNSDIDLKNNSDIDLKNNSDIDLKNNSDIDLKNNSDIDLKNNSKIDSKLILNVYNDVILGSYNSNPIFHNWINKNKKLIIPNIKNIIFIESINDGIKNHYDIFTLFINKYVKNNKTLNDLIKINDEKNINKLIKTINFDIINNTLDSNLNYHDWIKENILLIINEFNKKEYINLEKELESKTYSFIPFMLFMNKNLELNKSKKKYQIIPLRTNLTPKFIPINTDSFVDLLDSKYLLGNIKNYYHNESKRGLILFDTYFNFTSKYIKNIIKKGYKFSGLIQTNGYEIIFNFNSKSYDNKKNIFHQSGKKEIKNTKELIKNLPSEEKEKFINDHDKKKINDKKEKEKLSKENLKIKKNKEKEEEKNKLSKIGLEIDILDSKYKTELNELSIKHYDILKTEFNKIDKTNIKSKDKMNMILKILNEKLLSDQAYITHCHTRDKETLIKDFESNFNIDYNKLLNIDVENDKKINEIKSKILIKKKELIKLKKSNIVELKYIDTKKINSDKKIIKNTKRLLEKLRIKTELLNYEIIDKKISLSMIKEIKLYLINQIKKIYELNNYKQLNEYLNSLIDGNINNLNKLILNTSTLNTKLIFELCIKFISLNLSINKNDLLSIEFNRLQNNIINKELKEKNKTIDYKNKYNNILNELTNYSISLNKLIKIKNNNEKNLMNLFKIKSNDYMQIDYMSKKQIEIINKTNWIVIDPGMNSLLTMLSKDGKTKFSYTKEHHLNRTNRKKILKKIEKIKKNKISKLENKLTKDDIRLKTSNNYQNFKLYFDIKMEIHNELVKLYNDVKLNKLKWMIFINDPRFIYILCNKMYINTSITCICLLFL